MNTLLCGLRNRSWRERGYFAAPHEFAVLCTAAAPDQRKTRSGVADARDEHIVLPELHRNNPAFAEDRRAVPDEALAA